LLNAVSAGARYEVLNLAVPGYNARQQRLNLEERGPTFVPDLVIVAFVLNTSSWRVSARSTGSKPEALWVARDDHHPNGEAQRRAAGAIFEGLRRLGFVAPRSA